MKLGEKKVYEFFRQYLVPFNDSQVEKFLRKRYTLLQWRQRKKARQLVRKIPLLSIRPMLLTYIPDLIDSEEQIEYAFQLYEVLVEKWLEREVNTEALRTFSEHLAVELYTQRQKYGSERIPRSELVPLAKKWKFPDLEEWQLRGRSLLNRDAVGNYKFAHRSIMEYLVVRRLITGDEACSDIALTDQMDFFLREIVQSNVGKVNAQRYQTIHLEEAYLAGVDFREAYLIGANLRKINLSKADLTRADLTGANLENANLRGINLSEASLRNANLTHANLEDAVLQKSDLSMANLTYTNLVEANLSETSLMLANHDIRHYGPFYSGYQPAGMNLEGADLRRANLSGADLSDADLRMFDLRGANLSEANLTRTNLTGANLAGVNLRLSKNAVF